MTETLIMEKRLYYCAWRPNIMNEKKPNSLIPMPQRATTVYSGRQAGVRDSLNENQQEFQTREDVRQFLPDILGKVLARIWIDPEFHRQFSYDPVRTLAENGVKLPENMTIEFQRENTERPRIVVFEQRPGSNFKLRILYLQLVMMAGRSDGYVFRQPANP